jgi:hypothetical protein
MTLKSILILGGYGNAGLTIARLLVSQTTVGIILAGRNGERAQRAAEQLNAEFKTDCVSGRHVNAASHEALVEAFRQVEMVVVASSTIEFTQIVAEAALEAGIDYFDVQISAAAKRRVLEALREQILRSGSCFITDGGYRPGIPAAMVRYAATQIQGLESAPVASVFQVNWKKREFASSTAAEFADELKSLNPLVLKNGTWQPGKMSEMLDIDFGEPFGHKYCMPMFLEEFHSLPEFIPTLKETGFYSAGFGGVVDYLIVPLAFILLAIAPNRSRKLIARLVEWGLKHTTRPPYGAVLQMKAQGAGHSLTMTIFHLDSYILTAAPVVACLLQYLDGSLRKPGLWWQATLVEPVRFFEDLTRLGVQIKQEID